MLMKKERKIPGSVFKPHAEEVVLLQSVALGQPQPSARVFFQYPKYCFKDVGSGSESTVGKNKLEVRATGTTSADLKQGDSFLKIFERHKPGSLRSF